MSLLSSPPPQPLHATTTTTTAEGRSSPSVMSATNTTNTNKIKKSPKWYLIKSLVVLAVITIIVSALIIKQSTSQHLSKKFIMRSSRTATTITSSTKAEQSNVSSLMTMTMMSTNSVPNFFTLQKPQQQQKMMMNDREGEAEEEDDDDDGGDDDGNSKICHKVARFKLSKCQFVQKNCPEPLAGGLINYLQIRYCSFAKIPVLFFILSALWILFLFYLLSDTAETYFCPSLTEISSYLKLSPNVAGVTFLALGNGAPDIASILAGVFSGSAGFGVGEPIGAGLFVTTCVMAFVTLLSDVKVDGVPFLRDIGTYLFSVVFVFVICLTRGEIELWHALVCLAIYFVYVSVVVIGRAVHVYMKSRRLRLEKLEIEQQRVKSSGMVGTINNSSQQTTGDNGEVISEKTSLLLGNSQLHRTVGQGSTRYYDSVVMDDEDDAQVSTKWVKEPVLIQYINKTKQKTKKKGRGNKKNKGTKTEQQIQQESSENVAPIDSTVVLVKEDGDDRNESSGDEGDDEIDGVRESNGDLAEYGEDVTSKKWGNLKVQGVRDREKFGDSLKRHHNSGFFYPKFGLIYASSPNGNAATPTPTEDEMIRTKSFIFEDHFDANKSPMTPTTTTRSVQDSGYDSDSENEDDDINRSYIQQFLDWIEWNDKNWFDRLFYLLVSPAILARNLTIPQADPSCWSKFFAVLCPLFMGPFVLFAVGALDVKLGASQVFPLWALILMISAVISLVILVTTERHRPPIYHFIFVFSSFTMSIIWIYLVANELVSILQSCGIMWQISDGILAITCLAWGNSLGDMVANVVVAKQGYPDMAIGAVYGGPCLNLLIGLGLSMTAHCLKFKSFPIEMEPNVFMSFVFLLASISAALIIVPANGFRVPKMFGVFLLAIYGVFMVMSILIESGVIFNA